MLVDFGWMGSSQALEARGIPLDANTKTTEKGEAMTLAASIEADPSKNSREREPKQ